MRRALTPASKIWALVPAAGSGQRMGSDVPKQYLRIGDKTVLQHSLELISSTNKVEQTVLCTAPNDTTWSTLGLQVLHTVGGETRAQSVLNGLQTLSNYAAKDDWVLVHDAARPCLGVSAMCEFIDQLQHDQVGGILAMRCKDTLKQANIDEKGQAKIGHTVSREGVWQAQTPQMFRYGLLVQALTSALQQGADVTDEASAMEFAGYSPRLIAGDARNIKITTPEDLELSRFLLGV